MKLIVFLAVCVIATKTAAHQLTFSELTQIWQRFLLQHIDECVEKTGVDRVLAERLLPYGEYNEDPKLQCFVRCIGGNLKMVENDAESHPQNFLDVLNVHDPAIRAQIISQCFEQINKEDECAQVYHTSECVYFVIKKALTGKGKESKVYKSKP